MACNDEKQIRMMKIIAQEIANELAEIKPDIAQPIIPSCPYYSEKINEINRKCCVKLIDVSTSIFYSNSK